jgi:hypothetical protein
VKDEGWCLPTSRCEPRSRARALPANVYSLIDVTSLSQIHRPYKRVRVWHIISLGRALRLEACHHEVPKLNLHHRLPCNPKLTFTRSFIQRVKSSAPPGYTTPQFPSLYWPLPIGAARSYYLYQPGDIYASPCTGPYYLSVVSTLSLRYGLAWCSGGIGS